MHGERKGRVVPFHDASSWYDQVHTVSVKDKWNIITAHCPCDTLCTTFLTWTGLGSNPQFSHTSPWEGRFLELFQHWGHLAYCILAPNKFPHSSPKAPRIIQMRETSTSEGGNYYQILLANSNLRKSAKIFYMPQSWDMGQILLLPLRRKAYWGFSGHPKNPTRELGFQWPVR